MKKILYFSIFLVLISANTGEKCNNTTKDSLNCKACNANENYGCDECNTNFFTNRKAQGTFTNVSYASCLPCDENCETCDPSAQKPTAFEACSLAKGDRYLDKEKKEILDCNGKCYNLINDENVVIRKELCPNGCESCQQAKNEMAACVNKQNGYAFDVVQALVLPCGNNCLECVDRLFTCVADKCVAGMVVTNDDMACAKLIDGCDRQYLTPEGYCRKCDDISMEPSQDGKSCIKKNAVLNSTSSGITVRLSLGIFILMVSFLII